MNPTETPRPKSKRRERAQEPPLLPHSWSVESWPLHIFPGDATRARYLLRSHRRELVAAGALVRVGRQLVVLGPQFSAWLARQAERVPGFEVAANSSRPAAPEAA